MGVLGLWLPAIPVYGDGLTKVKRHRHGKISAVEASAPVDVLVEFYKEHIRRDADEGRLTTPGFLDRAAGFPCGRYANVCLDPHPVGRQASKALDVSGGDPDYLTGEFNGGCIAADSCRE